jgi:hypothetical protein
MRWLNPLCSQQLCWEGNPALTGVEERLLQTPLVSSDRDRERSFEMIIGLGAVVILALVTLYAFNQKGDVVVSLSVLRKLFEFTINAREKRPKSRL